MDIFINRQAHAAIKRFCEVSCALKKRTLFINSTDDKKVEFNLLVKMGSASLDFLVRFCDGEVARCQAKYVY